MTREEAKITLESYIALDSDIHNEFIDSIRVAVRVLGQPEHNDCVLKMFGECSYAETGCSDCKVKSMIAELLEQPERKTGRWIVRYECPNCGEGRGYAFDTCPMCGADMREGAE